jgi:hypothetical protein
MEPELNWTELHLSTFFTDGIPDEGEIQAAMNGGLSCQRHIGHILVLPGDVISSNLKSLSFIAA